VLLQKVLTHGRASVRMITFLALAPSGSSPLGALSLCQLVTDHWRGPGSRTVIGAIQIGHFTGGPCHRTERIQERSRR
jgi:hypothetical protein